MRTFRLGLLGALITAVMGAVPAYAHHSFAATYTVDKTETIQGTVIEFLFRYPHTYVHLMAPDKGGQMVEWAVEWAAGSALNGEHITSTTLKPGDKVIITGNPARDASLHRLRMNAIVRPSDGWKWAGTFG